MDFKEQIQNWVDADNKIKQLNDDLKKLRDNKNIITTNIMSYIETNNLTNPTIKIGNGLLKVVSIKETQPLYFRTICYISFLFYVF